MQKGDLSMSAKFFQSYFRYYGESLRYIVVSHVPKYKKKTLHTRLKTTISYLTVTFFKVTLFNIHGTVEIFDTTF